MTPATTSQRLAAIVASRPLWFRARLSTILVWPTIHGGWTAILHYAHCTTVQPGETVMGDVRCHFQHVVSKRSHAVAAAWPWAAAR
jgi:hypothetical protein